MECRTLDKTISNLEMELAAARAAQESMLSGSPLSEDVKKTGSSGKKGYLMVVGINTAFSSRKRRDSVRATWMPQGSWIVPYPPFLLRFLCYSDFWLDFFPPLLTGISNTLKLGEKRKKLEEEKGIIIRFVIGHRWDFNLILWFKQVDVKCF